jgi:hypothetical protein
MPEGFDGLGAENLRHLMAFLKSTSLPASSTASAPKVAAPKPIEALPASGAFFPDSVAPGVSRVLLVGGGSSHDFEKFFNQADAATLQAKGKIVTAYTPNAAEAIALRLELAPLGEQGCQAAAQRAQLLLRLVQLQLGLGALLFGPIAFGLAGRQLAATGLEAGFQLVEFKQSHPQPLAHEQHQAQGHRTDHAAGEHGDQHGRAPWPQMKQAQSGFANATPQPIPKGGKNAAQNQQRQNQQPAGHSNTQLRSVSLAPWGMGSLKVS